MRGTARGDIAWFQRHGRAAGGWTLVELLTVIAVIGILASLLFPVLARARGRATRTACASNMRQVGMAMLLYTQEWDGQFPGISHEVTDDPYAWTHTLVRYLRSPEAVWCPGDPLFGDRSARKGSYRVNNLFSSGALYGEVAHPSEVIYAGEAGLKFGDHYHPHHGVAAMRQELDPTRHGKGSHYLYLDAHVKWERFEATLHPVNRHLTDTGNENPKI